jgi:membrane protease YdiL (CAAX protease family)
MPSPSHASPRAEPVLAGDDARSRASPGSTPLIAFFGLTYAVTWICFIAAGFLTTRPSLGALRWPLLILGAFAPSTVAVYLTARAEGRPGVRALLRRLGEWRVGIRWYAFALFYMAVIKLAVALIYRATMGGWPRFGTGYGVAIILTAIVAAIFGGPLGEEIGWRGYALPRLAERYGRGSASVILGVIWACWHLPVFFIPGMDQSGQAFPVYVIQVTALSVAMAWLYWHTNGSLLLAVLMHTAINQTKDLVPSTVAGASDPWRFSSTPVAWLTVTLLCVAAAYFIVRMARARRSASS